MKIAVLADQHGALPPIPECDLMILSGDLTGGPDFVNGKWRPELSNDRWRDWLQTHFARWIQDAPFVIATGGNHDTAIELYGPPSLPNFHYLCDSGCEFGGLKFWGAPWVRRWDGLAFNLTDGDMEKKWDLVPAGTDVLVCHSPPLGGCDGGLGCRWLAHTIQRVRPKLLTCGHIHEGAGVFDLYGTQVVNAAMSFRMVVL